MRIVRTSNYDVENYNEKFVENIPTANSAHPVLQEIVNHLNKIDPKGEHYYSLVEDSYILKEYNPNA